MPGLIAAKAITPGQQVVGKFFAKKPIDMGELGNGWDIIKNLKP